MPKTDATVKDYKDSVIKEHNSCDIKRQIVSFWGSYAYDLFDRENSNNNLMTPNPHYT